MLQRWWHRQPLPLVLHHRQKSLHMREEKKEKMINYLAKVTTERRQKLTRQKDLSVKGWAKKKELLSWVRLLFLQCHLWHSLHSRGLFIQPFFQLERIGLFHASTPSCRVTLFDELMNLFYLCFAQKRVHRLECKATDSGSNNSTTSLICVLCMAGTGRRGKTTINHQSSCTSSLSLSLYSQHVHSLFCKIWLSHTIPCDCLFTIDFETGAEIHVFLPKTEAHCKYNGKHVIFELLKVLTCKFFPTPSSSILTSMPARLSISAFPTPDSSS